MIRKLIINNLKSIKNLEMECSNINLLIGTNSSGKSSIIQGLLFLGQNSEAAVGLNGSFISLGTLEENRCVYSEKKEISAEIEDEDNHQWKASLYYNHNVLTLNRNYGLDEDNPLKINMQYLSCHRLGPQNVYKKNMSIDERIGNNGEFAIAYLNSHGTDVLDEKLCREMKDFTLLGQINWWLNYITEADISTEEIIGTDLVKASYSMNDLRGIRPENIGSGISYLISILIMCLASQENAVLVIENPEIHLHPSAQAKVCEFLYFIARTNRQLFVESHSDHIFNGFRAGITTGEMDDDEINMQFVQLNEEHITETQKIKIGRLGRIENQQRGLFDQFDLDMNRMIGVRGDKDGADFK